MVVKSSVRKIKTWSPHFKWSLKSCTLDGQFLHFRSTQDWPGMLTKKYRLLGPNCTNSQTSGHINFVLEASVLQIPRPWPQKFRQARERAQEFHFNKKSPPPPKNDPAVSKLKISLWNHCFTSEVFSSSPIPQCSFLWIPVIPDFSILNNNITSSSRSPGKRKPYLLPLESGPTSSA